MITITNQADLEKFVTSKDPILYEIETDDAPDEVLCEIKDIDGNIVASITHKPLFGETNLFRFDIHGIIDDLIGTNMYVNAADLGTDIGYIDAPDSHFAFQCTFTEIINDSDSDSDYGDAVTEDDLRVAIAAIFEPLDTTRMTDRLLEDNKSKWLTNIIGFHRARLTDSFYAMVLFDVDGAYNSILEYTVRKINKDGSQAAATFAFPFAIDSDGVANYSYTIHIGIAPADINAALNTTFIDEDVVSYVIEKFKDTSPSVISRIYTVFVIEDCKPKSIRLHFLNRLGGFDSFLFTGQNIRNYDTNSKEFQSNFIESKFAITQDDGYKMFSDYLSDNEALVLREMLSSPEVYMEIDTKYMPVIIETKKLKVADSLNGMIKYEIDFHFAHKTKAQRR